MYTNTNWLLAQNISFLTVALRFDSAFNVDIVERLISREFAQGRFGTWGSHSRVAF